MADIENCENSEGLDVGESVRENDDADASRQLRGRERFNNSLKKYQFIVNFSFQILSICVLGGIGGTISVLDFLANKRESEMHEVQMEAVQNNAEPIFSIKSRPIDGELEGDGYSYTKKIYTIMNKGGKITGAYLSDVRKSMIIEIYGGGLPLEYKYTLDVGDLFEKSEGLLSVYDEDEKEFVFYERETPKLEELENSLRSKIEDMLAEKHKARINIYWEDTVCVEYINYENKEFMQYYQFIPGDTLIAASKENRVILGSANIGNDIEYIARNACNRIDEFMTSGKIEDPMSPKTNYNAEEERKVALDEVERYLDTYPSSREMLLDILENTWDYYHEDAVYAVDNCGADWNEQAIRKAKDYLFFDPISYEGLIDALETYEKFTHKQAVYGADNCGADWNEQAKQRAEKCVNDLKINSRDELIEQLESVDKFTHEQAIYGADAVDYGN